MSYIQAIILGLVQGLAEFLPISSSGHLALLQHFFGIQTDKVLLFTVMLHVGTLVSVFFMYWRDIIELIKAFCLMIKDLCTGKGAGLQQYPIRKMAVMIIVATIPTALIGFLFNDFFESLYSRIFMIGIGFIITGFFLFFSEKLAYARNGIERMNYRNSIFIGIMQGIAIYPGISRSGSTLTGGLFVGLKREFAVRFAFLISIPSILGSALLELPKALDAGVGSGGIGPVITGMIVAAACGVLAIKAVIKLVMNQKLKWFSYYVWALGTVVIIYSIAAH